MTAPKQITIQVQYANGVYASDFNAFQFLHEAGLKVYNAAVSLQSATTYGDGVEFRFIVGNPAALIPSKEGTNV